MKSLLAGRLFPHHVLVYFSTGGGMDFVLSFVLYEMFLTRRHWASIQYELGEKRGASSEVGLEQRAAGLTALTNEIPGAGGHKSDEPRCHSVQCFAAGVMNALQAKGAIR